MGMAMVGHTLHFSYSDMMEMYLKDFIFFVEQSKTFSSD